MKHVANTLREQGTLIQNTATTAGHFQVQRWHLPKISQQAQPGTLIHINGVTLPIMASDQNQKMVEVLLASDTAAGFDQSEYQVTAEFGQVYKINEARSQALLIGEEHGIAAVLFLAEKLKAHKQITPLILLGFDDHLPFRPQPSRIMTPDLPAHLIAAMPLLEDWNIASRIAHGGAAPGCFEDSLAQLSDYWLARQTQPEQIALYVCAGKASCDAIKRTAEGLPLAYQCITLD